MGKESVEPDIYGVRDELHQYYRRPTSLDGGDTEDAEFFLDVMSDVNRYISGVADNDTQYNVASGRSHHHYDVEEIEDVLESERENPRYEEGVPHLLSALHKLNQYRSKTDTTAAEPADVLEDPVDSSRLQKM